MRHFITVLLVTACAGGDDPDTGAATTAPAGSTAASTDGSSTAATSTTDGSSTAAASTTDGSTDTAGATSGASTSHTSHVTHTTHTTADTTGSGTTSSTTGEYQPPAPEELCACLVGGACHDFFHAKYGEDHEAAEAACLAEAEALPSAGMASESGNTIECRYHHCEAAARDISACDAAFGGAPCT